MERTKVVQNAAAGRFEAEVAGEVAFITYREGGGRILFLHTEVPEALEGRGVTTEFARAALDYARARHLTVFPFCPYVASYIRRHPEYRALVLEGFDLELRA